MTVKEVTAISNLLGRIAPIIEEEGYEVIAIENFGATRRTGDVKPNNEVMTIRIHPMVQEDSSAC